MLARVLLNRLKERLEQQASTKKKANVDLGSTETTDMIFTARQLQEKYQEQNVDLYTRNRMWTIVDLTKVFDTVSREGLLKSMAKFGCPPMFIAMVRQFCDFMLARVQNDGEFSDPFPVTKGVEQGCVLTSTLFSMMFSDAFQDGDNGIPIRYRFDGKLFNLRRLQAKSKEFLTADVMAKGTLTKKMQNGVDQVSDSCDSYHFLNQYQKRLRWYISQNLESLKRGLLSQ